MFSTIGKRRRLRSGASDRRRGGTMKTWQIQTTDGIDGLEQARLDLPDPGPGEVRVRLRANAINSRQLSVLGDPACRHIAQPRITHSDGGGGALAVGRSSDERRVGEEGVCTGGSGGCQR